VKEYLDEQLAMNSGFPFISQNGRQNMESLSWKTIAVPWLASVAAVQDNTPCVRREMWYLWNAAHMTILRVTSTSGILSMLVVT